MPSHMTPVVYPEKFIFTNNGIFNNIQILCCFLVYLAFVYFPADLIIEFHSYVVFFLTNMILFIFLLLT